MPSGDRAAVSVGAYGSFAIVGAHLPIALGTAFASKHLGDGGVTLCFFGDGAVNIGACSEIATRALPSIGGRRLPYAVVAWAIRARVTLRLGAPNTRTSPSTISRSEGDASSSSPAACKTCARASTAARQTAGPTLYVILLPPATPANGEVRLSPRSIRESPLRKPR